LPNFFAID